MMRWIRALFENEAAVAVALLEAVVLVAVAFGVDLTAEQVAGAAAAMVAIGGFLTKALVWSKSTHVKEVDRAYTSGVTAGARAGSSGGSDLRDA